MKTLLATLNVYVDKESKDVCSTGQRADGTFELNMNRGKGSPFEIHDMGEFQTVMAHELGHFIALTTGDPTHKTEKRLAFSLSGNAAYILPGEKKAWELARKMGFQLDEKQATAALKSYEDATWKSYNSFPPEPDSLPSWLTRFYCFVAIPVLALLGIVIRYGSHARPQYYRIRKDRVHRCVKVTLHLALFVSMIAFCVILSEFLHHWRAVTIASVSAASYAVKGVEVLTDVIADRLFPSMNMGS